ncbi:MAG TPA: hypothetical protein VGM29_07670 [Polyangiaceae bacterium]
MKRMLFGLAFLLVPRVAFAQSEPPPKHPFRVAAESTSAFGVTGARFFNQLAGARADYRFSERFAFGAGLFYTNLKGKDGRVSNALPELSLEYRLPLGSGPFGIPWRFAGGALPKNGPTLRWTVGLDANLSETVALELDPIVPMFWVTRDRPEVSLDVGALLKIAF